MGHLTTKITAVLVFSTFLVWSTSGWARQTTVDYSRGDSLVTFEAIGRPSMLKIHGKSAKPLHGSLALSDHKAAGAVSFELESLETGISTRDDHMKHKYLETQKYPQASLTITRIALPATLSGENLPFDGNLTLHGIEKPVHGTAAFAPKGKTMQTALHFELLLADYGITQPSFAGITMAKTVTVDVSANGAVEN